MTRQIPMGACLALLRAFDATNEQPQQTIAAAAEAVETDLGEDVAATLNNGQFAALIDFAIWRTMEDAGWAAMKGWVTNGNMVRPPKFLASLTIRGKAERDVWNVGADA